MDPLQDRCADQLLRARGAEQLHGGDVDENDLPRTWTRIASGDSSTSDRYRSSLSCNTAGVRLELGSLGQFGGPSTDVSSAAEAWAASVSSTSTRPVSTASPCDSKTHRMPSTCRPSMIGTPSHGRVTPLLGGAATATPWSARCGSYNATQKEVPHSASRHAARIATTSVTLRLAASSRAHHVKPREPIFALHVDCQARARLSRNRPVRRDRLVALACAMHPLRDLSQRHPGLEGPV